MKRPEKVLLVIAYYFPPTGSIGSERIKKITESLSEKFDLIHVITTKNPVIHGEEYEFPKNVIIHRVEYYDYRVLVKKGLKKEQTLTLKSNKVSWHIKYFRKLLESYPFRIFFGEGGILYKKNVLKKAKEILETERITHLFSSFRPAVDHEIAKKIKILNPNLNWWADFRDLPVDKVRGNSIWPKIDIKKWKNIISKANLISSVSEGQGDELSGITNKKSHTLFNGFSDTQINQGEKVLKENFIISYTGSIYGNLQNPEPILKWIKNHPEKNKITFIYAGKDSEIIKYYFSKYDLLGNLMSNNTLTEIDSTNIQRKADINLVLSWSYQKSKGILTGKLFSYIAARKPILVILKGEIDKDWEHIKNQYQNIEIINENHQEDITKILDSKYEKYKNGNIELVTLDKIMPLSWENTFAKFLKETNWHEN
jgi:hypothetical protein